MAISPIVTVTIQATLLAAFSNILAQFLTAQRKEIPLVIDWVPVSQFVFFTVINTPPNFLWQDFLEQTWPAYHAAPTNEAIKSAAENDEKALDDEARTGRIVEPRLNVRNTVTKFLLDQTIGSVVNTILFTLFMNGIQAAMTPLSDENIAYHPSRSVAFLMSGRAVDYGRVDWNAIVAQTKADFVPIITAGWRLWPLVSVVNFAFIKSVEMRNLVAALAGVGWGVYMSLFAAK